MCREPVNLPSPARINKDLILRRLKGFLRPTRGRHKLELAVNGIYRRPGVRLQQPVRPYLTATVLSRPGITCVSAIGLIMSSTPPRLYRTLYRPSL